MEYLHKSGDNRSITILSSLLWPALLELGPACPDHPHPWTSAPSLIIGLQGTVVRILSLALDTPTVDLIQLPSCNMISRLRFLVSEIGHGCLIGLS